MRKLLLNCLLVLPVIASAADNINQQIMFSGFPNNAIFTNKPIVLEEGRQKPSQMSAKYPLMFPPNNSIEFADEGQYHMSCSAATLLGVDTDYSCNGYFVTDIAWSSSGISHQCSVMVKLSLSGGSPGKNIDKTHDYSTTGDCTSTSKKEGKVIWFFTPK